MKILAMTLVQQATRKKQKRVTGVTDRRFTEFAVEKGGMNFASAFRGDNEGGGKGFTLIQGGKDVVSPARIRRKSRSGNGGILYRDNGRGEKTGGTRGEKGKMGGKKCSLGGIK